MKLFAQLFWWVSDESGDAFDGGVDAVEEVGAVAGRGRHTLGAKARIWGRAMSRKAGASGYLSGGGVFSCVLRAPVRKTVL